MHLTLHMTRSCNLRCSYCYAAHDSRPAMSLDTACEALRFGARTTDGSCGIVFFGGEPLLCTDLIRDVVREARSMQAREEGRFHFNITTNGLLLDEAFLPFADEEDILIAVSCDGVREAHDKHRRAPDGSPSFDLLLPRLRMLLAARPYASVLMVVNPDTVEHFVDSVAFLLDEGCRYLVVSLNYAADWTEADLDDLNRQCERLADLYVEWTREGRKFYLSPFEVKLSSHIQGEDVVKEHCELGVRQLSIDPDGFIYPCVQFTTAGRASAYCIGDVRSGVDEAKRAALRDESRKQREPCHDCALSQRCHNTCGCLNWQTTGSVSGISPVMCRYEQIMIALADRVGETLFRENNELFLNKHYNPAYPMLSLIEDRQRA